MCFFFSSFKWLKIACSLYAIRCVQTTVCLALNENWMSCAASTSFMRHDKYHPIGSYDKIKATTQFLFFIFFGFIHRTTQWPFLLSPTVATAHGFCVDKHRFSYIHFNFLINIFMHFIRLGFPLTFFLLFTYVFVATHSVFFYSFTLCLLSFLFLFFDVFRKNAASNIQYWNSLDLRARFKYAPNHISYFDLQFNFQKWTFPARILQSFKPKQK